MQKQDSKPKENNNLLSLPQSSEWTTAGIPTTAYGTSSQKYGNVYDSGLQVNTPMDYLYSKTQVLPTTTETNRFNTALQEEVYYDPFTGKEIESFKYW
jgi:hypothetical protein